MVKAICQNCIPVAIAGGNSLTVRTAGGKVLGAPRPGWNSEFGPAMLEFARLSDSEKHPTELQRQADEPIRGQLPQGVLAARVYIRNLQRGAFGDLTPNGYHSKHYMGPQRDFVWLTHDEWRSLVPRDPHVGSSQSVPPAIARRLFTFYLVDSTVGLCALWDDEDIRQGKLDLKVIRADETGTQMQLTGSVVLSDDEDLSVSPRRAQFKWLGIVEADHAGEIQRFDVIALGEWFHSTRREYYAKRGLQESATLGLYFELAHPKSLGYGVPPSAIRNGKDDAYKKYFGKTRADLGFPFAGHAHADESIGTKPKRDTAGFPALAEANQAQECSQCQLGSAIGGSTIATITPQTGTSGSQPAIAVSPSTFGRPDGFNEEEPTKLWLILLLVVGGALLGIVIVFRLQQRQDVPIYPLHEVAASPRHDRTRHQI